MSSCLSANASRSRRIVAVETRSASDSSSMSTWPSVVSESRMKATRSRWGVRSPFSAGMARSSIGELSGCGFSHKGHVDLALSRAHLVKVSEIDASELAESQSAVDDRDTLGASEQHRAQ